MSALALGRDPEVLAAKVVCVVLADLKLRKGIGDELDYIGTDVYDEMREDLIRVVEKELTR